MISQYIQLMDPKEIRADAQEIANRYRDAMGVERDLRRLAFMVSEMALILMRENEQKKGK